MTQKEIAQAAKSWQEEDKDNRAVITILTEQGGEDIVVTNLMGLDTYAYALSRLFKESKFARIAAIVALAAIREEEGNEK